MMAGPLIPLTPLTEDAAICEGGICALPGAKPAPETDAAPASGNAPDAAPPAAGQPATAPDKP